MGRGDTEKVSQSSPLLSLGTISCIVFGWGQGCAVAAAVLCAVLGSILPLSYVRERIRNCAHLILGFSLPAIKIICCCAVCHRLTAARVLLVGFGKLAAEVPVECALHQQLYQLLLLFFVFHSEAEVIQQLLCAFS